MSATLIFIANWRKWQRVVRHHKGFGFFDSVRFGLWLARGSAAPAPKAEPRGEMYGSVHTA